MGLTSSSLIIFFKYDYTAARCKLQYCWRATNNIIVVLILLWCLYSKFGIKLLIIDSYPTTCGDSTTRCSNNIRVNILKVQHNRKIIMLYGISILIFPESIRITCTPRELRAVRNECTTRDNVQTHPLPLQQPCKSATTADQWQRRTLDLRRWSAPWRCPRATESASLAPCPA